MYVHGTPFYTGHLNLKIWSMHIPGTSFPMNTEMIMCVSIFSYLIIDGFQVLLGLKTKIFKYVLIQAF